MRYRHQWIAWLLALAVAGWLARAPLEPYARADYLCAPVRFAAHTAAQLEAALSDADQVVPPEHAAWPDPAFGCAKLVLRLSDDGPS